MTTDDWLTVVTVLGLTGSGLLVGASLIGIVMAARAVKHFSFLRGRAFSWHQWGTTFIAVVMLSHSLMSLTTSDRTKIVWQNILVPFTATKETLWLGIGSVALYILVITVAISLTIRKQHLKLWRVLHYGTYIALALGLTHSLFISSTFQPDWKLDFLDAEKVTVELFGLVLVAAAVFRIRRGAA